MSRSKKEISLENRLLAESRPRDPRSSRLAHLSASVLISLFVIILAQFSLDAMKGLLVDLQIRAHWWKSPHPDIVLIGYDNRSSARYDRSDRIPPEELSAILQNLEKEGPRSVAVIANLSEKSYSEPELRLLATAFERLPQSFVGFTDDESLGRSQPGVLNLVGRYFPGFVSRDTFSYGMDSVTRRVMLNVGGFPTIYSKLACLSRGESHLETCLAGLRHEGLGDSLQSYIRWQGPTGTYAITPSYLVSTGEFPANLFRDKIVLIGSHQESRVNSDFVLTPFNREPGTTSLLEAAAQGLATLLDNKGLVKSPGWVDLVLSLVLALLTVNLALLLSPGRGIFFVGVVLTILGLSSFAMLHGFQIWLNLAHPIIATATAYYLVIPYRLVEEYRKRWHYQEKSELMAELEQLKSNFLSLVSHDLKTPVARIQGNVELLLSERAGLTEKQRKSLDGILTTTDDLTQYVETVLDLTRVESSQVPIQKQTKDVNAVIGEVVESRKAMAAEKGIVLKSQLEPIFSFRFDARLIRRVLSNIVENAIKYSPSGTTVTIISKEDADWIRVSVADQGVGIPEAEQEKVFDKFYRCDNDQTKEAKGTGLGLYLVKYFVELHQGFIELNSEPGKGSMFTVALPV